MLIPREWGSGVMVDACLVMQEAIFASLVFLAVEGASLF
jgi:hypothetical protein